MRGIFFQGVKKVGIRELDDPKPGPNEVLVRIKASAICAADLEPYYGKPHIGVGAKAIGAVIPGHEGCGVVEEIGKNVKHVKEGDRIAIYCFIGCGHCEHCRSGYLMFCRDAKCLGFDVDGTDAELLVIPKYNCLHFPDKMSFIEGALSTDAVGTTYHAAKKIGVNGEDSVAIFGVGPIGLTSLLICKGLGAKVFCVDLVEERLTIAKRLGADQVINAKEEEPVKTIKDLTDGKGASKAIDCSGSAEAESNALDCVRIHGKVAFVGWGLETRVKPATQLITKDVTVSGSWYFNIGEYPKIIEFILNKNLKLEETVTHRFPLESADEAFMLFDTKKTMKVVFVP